MTDLEVGTDPAMAASLFPHILPEELRVYYSDVINGGAGTIEWETGSDHIQMRFKGLPSTHLLSVALGSPKVTQRIDRYFTTPSALFLMTGEGTQQIRSELGREFLIRHKAQNPRFKKGIEIDGSKKETLLSYLGTEIVILDRSKWCYPYKDMDGVEVDLDCVFIWSGKNRILLGESTSLIFDRQDGVMDLFNAVASALKLDLGRQIRKSYFEIALEQTA